MYLPYKNVILEFDFRGYEEILEMEEQIVRVLRAKEVNLVCLVLK